MLDTGAMYRAVTLAVLEAKVALDDADACAAIARASVITVEDGVTMLDGRDVSARDPGPGRHRRGLDRLGASRRCATVLVAHSASGSSATAAESSKGRDIGTVVFPDATVKVFLVASDDERARRRQRDEMAAARAVAVDEVKAALDRRDAIDSGRAVSPLRAADDAIVIDTTAPRRRHGRRRHRRRGSEPRRHR